MTDKTRDTLKIGMDINAREITLTITADEAKEILTALSESPEPKEDGTLVVHTKDGSKVNRVLVMGDNIFGGLYYPDSAKTDTAKPEEGAELIDRRQIKWYGCDHEGHIKGINCDTADCSKCFFATVEHDEVMSLPVYRIPDSAENKGEPKTGHWIGHVEHCESIGAIPSGLGAYKWCSNCDCGIDAMEWHRNNYNFCPNCGADMRGE